MPNKGPLDPDQLLAAGGKIRVKTGCITCRIRRVKCDEKKPSCLRCTSTGRKCDGYSQTPQSQQQLTKALQKRKSPAPLAQILSRDLKTSGLNDESESLSFSFYLSKTTPKTNAFFGSDFWDRLVLQISHSEPAVKHAVLALSALHRSWEGDSHAFIQDKSALVQYSKAVSYAGALLEESQGPGTRDRESVEKVLVACILFICYENLVGNYASAQMHLRNGMSILLGHRKRIKASGGDGSGGGVEDEIVHLLGRFDFQAMTLSDDASPYQYFLGGLDGVGLEPLPAVFMSLKEARRFLFDLVRHIFRIGESIYEPGDGAANFLAEKQRCETDLKRWTSLFETFLLQNPEKDRQAQHAITFLRVYHITATVIVSAGFTGRETAYDACKTQFEEILALAETSKIGGYSAFVAQTRDSGSEKTSSACKKKFFSLEVGLSVALFYMSIKCRDPVLRRRAIAILGYSNRREGLWDSLGAALVAERVMLIEEKGAMATLVQDGDLGIQGELELESNQGAAGKVTAAAQIPEEKRVVMVQTMAQIERRQVRLNLLTRPDGPEGRWAVREEWVDC